jgi:hypothetical protein
MSRAEQIRAYLRTVGATSPETAVQRSQIRAALGLTKNQSSSGINDLKTAGFIASVGEVRTMGYYVTGKVPAVALGPAEVREREKARQIRRRRMAGSLSRAEYLAGCAAKRDAAAAEREQRKQARAAKKGAKKSGAKRQKVSVAKLLERKRNAIRVGKARAALKHEHRFTSIKPVQVAQPLPSSADFLAAGGVIERLEGFAPRPFRAMPFNNRAEAA